MKNFINKSLLIAICSAAVIGCKPKFDEPAASHGSADFSHFVTIGDGTAGGYADASLNREAQLAAFPNILATQFKLAGGGDFIQPLVLPWTSALTHHTYKSFGFENNKPYTRYYLTTRNFCSGPELYPTMEDSAIFKQNDVFTILSFTVEPSPTGHYNNLAAQGTKMIYINAKPGIGWFHAPSVSSTASTYWKKISSTSSKNGATASTMLKDAVAQSPTFVCINVGAVDALRYAKSGGNQAGGDDDMITPVTEFHDSLYSILNTLKANNPNIKGVITNIIDASSFPYFTYIKYDGLLLSQAQADALNTFHGGQFSFHAGRNAYVMRDPSAANGKRQIKKGEYIIIETPPDSLRCHSYGGQIPMMAKWVLDETELSAVNTAVASYNSILKAAAAAYNFAFVDGNANIKEVVKGTQYMGIKYTAEMVVGNQFSVDGLNISPFGQAVLANNCIVEINKKYGSTIPFYDATKARGVLFE